MTQGRLGDHKGDSRERESRQLWRAGAFPCLKQQIWRHILSNILPILLYYFSFFSPFLCLTGLPSKRVKDAEGLAFPPSFLQPHMPLVLPTDWGGGGSVLSLCLNYIKMAMDNFLSNLTRKCGLRWITLCVLILSPAWLMEEKASVFISHATSAYYSLCVQELLLL